MYFKKNITRLWRLGAGFAVTSLVVNSAARGIESCLNDVSSLLLQASAPMFSQKPQQVTYTAREICTTGRALRPGWSEKHHTLAEKLRIEKLIEGQDFLASLVPTFLQAGGGGQGGPSMDGEGSIPLKFPFKEASVNMLTGGVHLFQSLFGFSYGEKLIPFTLSYSSLAAEPNGGGWNWRHTGQIRLRFADEMAIVQMDDGSDLIFTPKKGGGFYRPGYKLLEKAGGWELQANDQSRYEFDADGYVRRYVSRKGTTLTYRWDRGLLLSITAGDRAIGLTYQDGKLRTVTDPANRTWTFTVNSSNNLERIDWPAVTIDGKLQYASQHFTYNPAHQITALTDRNGNQWTLDHFDNGRLKSSQTPNIPTEITYYNYEPRHSWVIYPENNDTLQFYYNNNNLIGKTIDAAGFERLYSYYPNNLLESITDERKFLWEYRWDDSGNLTYTSDPEGRVTETRYNEFNDVIRIIYPDKSEVVKEYYPGPEGNARAVYDGLGKVRKTYTYTPENQVETETDGEGRLTFHQYNVYGNQELVYYPDNTFEFITYNVLGYPETSTNALYETITFIPDEWMRTVATVRQNGDIISYSYDLEGHKTKEVDGRGNPTFWNYRPSGEVANGIDRLGYSTVYSYDKKRRLTRVTNPRGYEIEYHWTPNDQLWQEILPGSATTTFTYYPTGQRYRMTTPMREVIEFTIDRSGRQTRIQAPGVTISYAENLFQRWERVTDSTGATTRYYDASGKTTRLVAPQGEVQYRYNNAGQRTKVILPGVGETITNYDPTTGQISSVINPQGGITRYSYEGLGRAWKKELPNGTSEENLYDNYNRVITKKLRDRQNNPLSQVVLQLDPNLNLVEKTVTLSGQPIRTTTYEYDQNDQLIEEAGPGNLQSFRYDENGNRFLHIVNGVTKTYTVDQADRLVSINSSDGNNVRYENDLAGRRVTETGNAGSTRYSYDPLDQLTSITYPDSTKETFAYNGFGARMMRNAGTITNFVRDGQHVTSPILSDGQATYSPYGDWEIRGETTTQYHGYGDDLTTQVNNRNSSQIASHQEFDAFGNELWRQGSPVGPFNFSGTVGGYRETRSGLVHQGHRYYDPKTGRWITRDKARSGLNWYAYCNNNPGLSDVDGQEAATLLGVGAMGGPVGLGVAAGAVAAIYTLGVIDYATGGAISKPIEKGVKGIAGTVSDAVSDAWGAVVDWWNGPAPMPNQPPLWNGVVYSSTLDAALGGLSAGAAGALGDWLNSLPGWKNIPTLEELLADYIGNVVVPTLYLQLFGMDPNDPNKSNLEKIINELIDFANKIRSFKDKTPWPPRVA